MRRLGPAGRSWRPLVPVALTAVALASVFVWLAATGDEQGTGTEPVTTCSPIGDVRAPASSHPSGFYDEPVTITITPRAGSGPLWYTLDGSTPDPQQNPATLEYTGPITVVDQTGSPLDISTIRTHIDPDALAEGREGSATWDLADPGIDQATVIRARQRGAGECVVVLFVGEHLRRADLAVAHLTTDPDHLFDDETGIYVPGKVFRDYLQGPDYDPDDGGWPFLPANYRERGRNWERPSPDDLDRPIVLHWFEPGGELGYLTNVGLRIHGGATRSLPQKSLRLYARNDYGGRTFEYPFFGDGRPATQRRLVLRNSGNDCVCANPVPASPRAHLADDFVHALVEGLHVETQASRPVVLFINGEYWGLHQLRQRYDEHHLSIVHGVPADQVVVLDHALDVQVGRDGDEADFVELLDLMATSDPDDPGTLAEVERRIDLDNFLDYMIVETFASNGDWPQSNIELWRTRTTVPSATGQGDGRWRWLLFDVDALGYWGFDPEADPFNRILQVPDEERMWRATPYLFERLLRIDEVRERFLDRFDELLASTFAVERSRSVLERLISLQEPEMGHQRDRWFAGIDDEQWAREHSYDGIRRFVERRPDAVRAELAAHFGER